MTTEIGPVARCLKPPERGDFDGRVADDIQQFAVAPDIAFKRRDVEITNDDRRVGQKLDFVERMTRWSETLADPTIIVGDFNIAPLESDVWGHRELLNVVSHTPVEVAALGRLQAAGNWTDLGRHFVPAPQRLYTWWSYRAKDWAASDRGRRLDHMWATPDVAAQAVAHAVHEPCRSWEKPSDHVPLVTEFAF